MSSLGLLLYRTVQPSDMLDEIYAALGKDAEEGKESKDDVKSTPPPTTSSPTNYRGLLVSVPFSPFEKVVGDCSTGTCQKSSSTTIDVLVDVTDPFGFAWSMRDTSSDPILRVYLCDDCVFHLDTTISGCLLPRCVGDCDTYIIIHQKGGSHN